MPRSLPQTSIPYRQAYTPLFIVSVVYSWHHLPLSFIFRLLFSPLVSHINWLDHLCSNSLDRHALLRGARGPWTESQWNLRPIALRPSRNHTITHHADHADRNKDTLSASQPRVRALYHDLSPFLPLSPRIIIFITAIVLFLLSDVFLSEFQSYRLKGIPRITNNCIWSSTNRRNETALS